MGAAIFLKSFLALFFVGGLIILTAIFYRKFGNIKQYNPNAQITLESSLLIDPKRKVILIKYGQRKHLILLGADSETIIETITE